MPITVFLLRLVTLMDRLDKILSRELNITRSEAKQFVRSKRVKINGIVALKCDVKCSDNDEICVDEKRIDNNKFVYIMMNKPSGVVSASEGKGEKTVVDILPDDMKRRGLFPAGRLDKDTTGFVLITDDGEFAHDILSPKKHIEKTYIAHLDKPFDESVVEDFESGMELNGNRLMQALLEPVDDDYTCAKIIIRQGLYHQIKRMFKKHGITVVKLHRTRMGNLPLDDNLGAGECKYLSQNEINLIKK